MLYYMCHISGCRSFPFVTLRDFDGIALFQGKLWQKSLLTGLRPNKRISRIAVDSLFHRNVKRDAVCIFGSILSILYLCCRATLWFFTLCQMRLLMAIILLSIQSHAFLADIFPCLPSTLSNRVASHRFVVSDQNFLLNSRSTYHLYLDYYICSFWEKLWWTIDRKFMEVIYIYTWKIFLLEHRENVHILAIQAHLFWILCCWL